MRRGSHPGGPRKARWKPGPAPILKKSFGAQVAKLVARGCDKDDGATVGTRLDDLESVRPCRQPAATFCRAPVPTTPGCKDAERREGIVGALHDGEDIECFGGFQPGADLERRRVSFRCEPLEFFAMDWSELENGRAKGRFE